MTATNKSPEQLRADRLAREAAERELAVEKFNAQRVQLSGWLQMAGWFLLAVGFWFLLVDPGEGSSFVNLQKLYIGQTAGIVGAIFMATGLFLKYL